MPEPDELPSWAAASGGEELPSWADGAEVLDEPEGLPAIPEGYREQGRRELTLPETAIVGDASGRGRGSVSTRPASEAVETREIEKDPVFARHRARTVGQQVGPDRRDTLARVADVPLNPIMQRADLGPQVYSGHQIPTLNSIRRFTQSGRFNDLAPPAPGLSPAAVEVSEYGPLIAAADAAPGLFGPLAELVHGEGWGDYARREADTVREQQPADAAVGSVIGSVPYMLIPGAQETALARVGSAGLTGFGLGGMRAADESRAQDFAGLARDTLAGGATEGATAATIGAGAESVSPMLSRLSQWARARAAQVGESLEPAAVQSRLEGTGAWGNRAMRAADRMPGGPEALAADLRRLGIGHGVGEPGRVMRARRAGAPLQRAVLPHSARAPDDAAQVMRDAGERMRSVIDRMDDAAAGRNAALLEGTREQAMRGMVDLSRVADEVDAIAREYEGLPVGGPQIAARLRSEIVEPMRAHGVVSFGTAHRQRRLLDGLIRDWGDQPMLTTASSRLRAARQELSGAMDDAVGRTLGPSGASQWRQANRDFSVGAWVGEQGLGASRLSVGGGMGGAVGTGVELAMAGNPITQIPATVLNRELAQQQRMRWPGLRAVALESLAARLRALGPEASRYAATLEAAQRRGPAALGIAHNALVRVDPAYRAAVERAQAQEPAANAQQLEPFTFTAPETGQ